VASVHRIASLNHGEPLMQKPHSSLCARALASRGGAFDALSTHVAVNAADLDECAHRAPVEAR